MRNLISIVSAVSMAALVAGCASKAESAQPAYTVAGRVPTVALRSGAAGHPAGVSRGSPTTEELAKAPAQIVFIWFDNLVTTWEKVCPNDRPSRHCVLTRTDDPHIRR